VASPAPDGPTSFLADAMLGRLARWLRVVGIDTLQLPTDAPDAALVARARDDERVLLTRDRHLLRELRPHRELAIKSQVPLVQLGEVARVRVEAARGAAHAVSARQHTARRDDAGADRRAGAAALARAGGPDAAMSDVRTCVLARFACAADGGRTRDGVAGVGE
jgi:predicted nuclease of predicted toxin-antitoxin system